MPAKPTVCPICRTDRQRRRRLHGGAIICQGPRPERVPWGWDYLGPITGGGRL